MVEAWSGHSLMIYLLVLIVHEFITYSNTFRCILLYSYTFYFIQVRDTLSAENADLHGQLQEAKVRIHVLQQHLETIRGHTIGFILEQMNTLHIETKESQL